MVRRQVLAREIIPCKPVDRDVRNTTRPSSGKNVQGTLPLSMFVDPRLPDNYIGGPYTNSLPTVSVAALLLLTWLCATYVSAQDCEHYQCRG